jgi:hypothetical protein
MRASDLIGLDVVDLGGTRLGRVRDLRVVQDGPLHASGQAGLQLHGLLVGRWAVGTRLGYLSDAVPSSDRETRGPAAIRWLARRLHHSARYIDWDDIVAIEPTRIVARRSETPS